MHITQKNAGVDFRLLNGLIPTDNTKPRHLWFHKRLKAIRIAKFYDSFRNDYIRYNLLANHSQPGLDIVILD